MKYFLSLISFCLLLFGVPKNGISQVLKVGNKLHINSCDSNKPEFVGIEIYSRANEYDKTEVDSLTGKGLSKSFFNTKSLEGKRLPCSMGGRKYTIAAIDKYTDKGITHTIVLLYDYYYLNLILVDYETAILNNEIFTQPKKVIKVKKKSSKKVK